MSRIRLAAAGCALALLSSAGCGGDDPAPAAAGGQDGAAADLPTDVPTDLPTDVPAGESSIDPCTLVGDEEMAGILTEQLPADEGAVTVTSENESLGPDTCVYSWTRETWAEGAGKEFTIKVMPDDDLTYTAAIGDRTPIEGAGDEAFVTSGNYFARVGDQVVYLVNLQETDEASVAVLTAAAANL